MTDLSSRAVMDPQPAYPPAGAMPPYVPLEAPPAKRGVSGLIVAIIAVFALLIGAGIGYAASIPQRSTLQDEKAAVETAKANLQSDLDGVRKDLDATKADLDSTKSKLAGAQKAAAAKDTCSKAAADAGDLIAEFENLLDDFVTGGEAAAGSAERAAVQTHVTEQLQRMKSQAGIVDDELTACEAAVG